MAHESDTSSLKTSLLLNQQVPEFVREEHPLFISFLEAYYEFLETEQGTQNNDLTKTAKDLRFIQDVDDSIASFESNFLNTYANLVPKDAVADKAFLIKNILPIYLAKGNKKSFDFLFRLLYGEEADVRFPKDEILRASDGEYNVERVLRLRDIVATYYVGDGTTNIFKLAQPVSEDEISVFINGVKQFSTGDSASFHTRKEEKKIIFTSPPSVNADVRVEYNDFTESVLVSRKVVGATSNASAIVEASVPRLLESQRSIELFVNRDTLLGTFAQGEQILIDIIDDENDLINISCNTTSSLEVIRVLEGGTGYNIGDPVTITAGGFEQEGAAEVSVVRSGFTDNATIHFGGAGFRTSDLVVGTSGNAQTTFAVTSVGTGVLNQQNTFTLSTTRIDEIDVDQALTSSDYGFLANVIAGGGTTGLSGIVLDSVSGNSGLYGYEERVVSNTANLQQFANSTIRPVFHYVSGNSFTGDIQLDEIYVGDGLTGNVANFTFESINIGTNEAINVYGWQTSTGNINNYSSVTFTDMSPLPTTTPGRWNRLAGSTPSSNTGVPFDATAGGAWYVYAETSSTGNPFANFWFRGPFIQLGSAPTFKYKVARFGSTIGTLRVYFDVTSNALGGGENVSTRIVDCLQDETLTDLGPIDGLVLLTSNATGNVISFDSDGPGIDSGDRVIKIKPFRSLGRFRINNGGTGYQPADEIIFTNTGTGFGSAAAVKSVAANGAITEIEFQPSRIAGNARVSGTLNLVEGFGTSFNTELTVGDEIIINNESRFVNSITDATHLTVNANFTNTTTQKKLGAYRRHIIGGQNYTENVFPTLGVHSYSGGGSGANIEISAAMADQEQIAATSNGVTGVVEQIRITEPGLGYRAVPTVDLTTSGDGLATAEAEIQTSLRTFPGRWTSSRGIISASERKLQGLDYYQDYIYVTNVPVEFQKYKSILKGLAHPAGFKNYAEFDLTKNVDIGVDAVVNVSNVLAGTVNVTANSVYITGSNTRFVTVKNTSGNLVNTGTKVVVNNEIRTVNTVISNTNVEVTAVFTSNATSQSIIIIA